MPSEMSALIQRKNRPRDRFCYEFWVICLVVALGWIHSLAIGFYQFRLVDAILILSGIYLIHMLTKDRINKQIAWVLYAHIAIILARIIYESNAPTGIVSLRTLLGMTAIYVTPIIFFVTRETHLTRRIAFSLIIFACLVSLISQMGLLQWGEGYAGGSIGLGKLFGLKTSSANPSVLYTLGYMETTITVWRALSVGFAFGLLLSKTGPLIKLIGILAFILQFGGAGGTRSSMIFVFITPIVLFLFYGSMSRAKKIRKLSVGMSIGLILAVVYIWAPIGGARTINKGMTHYERTVETLKFFTSGNTQGLSLQFQDRIHVIVEYWNVINSDPTIFFFGRGYSNVGNFVRTFQSVMTQAHNFIVDIWYLSGLVGLAFFFVFLGYVISDLKKLLQEVPPIKPELQIIAITFASAVIYMFQYLFFQAVASDRSFMIVFFLLAGLLKPTTNEIRRIYTRKARLAQADQKRNHVTV